MKTVIYLVLALSVLFNVFFAVGYLRAQELAKAAVEREQAVEASQRDVDGERRRDDRDLHRRVMRELELTDAQGAQWQALHEARRADEQQMQARMAFVRDDIQAALAAEPVDDERVRELLQQAAALRAAHHAAGAAKFEQFLATLEPEQMRRMAERMATRHDWAERRREEMRAQMLERFDTDGDGELDDTERAAARASMREGQSERRARMREQMFERLDTDGDGVISADEFEAARGVLGGRGGRGGRGPRGGGW